MSLVKFKVGEKTWEMAQRSAVLSYCELRGVHLGAWPISALPD